jgi:hypothetical protein
MRRSFQSILLKSSLSSSYSSCYYYFSSCVVSVERSGSERMMSRRDEVMVGIAAFANQCEGFSGILKQVDNLRYFVRFLIVISSSLSFSLSLSLSLSSLSLLSLEILRFYCS